MGEKKCPHRGQDKGLKITYYNEMDGTGLHMLCSECLDKFLERLINK